MSSLTSLHRPVLVAAIVVLGFATGCSSADARGDVADADPVTMSPPTTSTAADTSPPVSDPGPRATPTSEPEVSPSAPAALAAAVAALGSAYTFESEIIVNGTRASLATGRRVDGAVEVVLQQKGTNLVYRSFGGERWLQLPDGTWERLQDDTTPLDPLAPLLSPTDLDTVGQDGEELTLRGTYAAAALSLPGSGDVTVDLAVIDGKLATVDVVEEFTGHAVELHTAFAQDPDAAPIVSPETAP